MSVKIIEIHGANECAVITKTREGCRGIVVRDSLVLVSHEINSGFYLIPGGGLEDGETPEECCIREVREETGYTVKPVKHFITLNEYYEDCKYVSHYYVCEITGKGEQELTPWEKERGLTAEWMTFEDFYEIVSKHEDFAETNEEMRGSFLRECTVLKEYTAQFLQS